MTPVTVVPERWNNRGKLVFSMEFITPAFLGDAEQKAAWQASVFDVNTLKMNRN